MIVQKTVGLIAIPFTPMHPDRSVNLDAIEGYANWRFLKRLAMILFACFIMMRNDYLCKADDSLAWSKLPSLPDVHGFAGPFVGTHNGALLVAGGANFPDKKPWEGGTKVWYDRVFVLERPDDAWKAAGKLPRPLGYGVSLNTKIGVVCIGGSDPNRHYADVFVMRWENGELTMSSLPSLPKPCANFCGEMLGNTIHVAGGIETPTSTNALKTFWSLDLDSNEPRWQELEAWPGPARMLAVLRCKTIRFFL